MSTRSSTVVERQDILDALRRLRDPHSGKDIVESGFMARLWVRSGTVKLVLKAPVGESACPQYVPLAVEAKRMVMAIRGVKRVDALLTGHVQERAVNEALKMLDEHIGHVRKGGQRP